MVHGVKGRYVAWGSGKFSTDRVSAGKPALQVLYTQPV